MQKVDDSPVRDTSSTSFASANCRSLMVLLVHLDLCREGTSMGALERQTKQQQNYLCINSSLMIAKFKIIFAT